MTVSVRGRIRGDFPAEATSFVGRRTELSEVKRALESARLVSLTGVGGVGKTRLAWRVATELARAFPDGVCVVELAGLEDEGLLPQAVVTAMGISDQATRWTSATLAAHLADKRMLLVLDNCEHLVEACAALATAALERSPRMRILVTSRETLRVAGERVVSVPTLGCPEVDVSTPPSSLVGSEAVALFVDRAATVVPGFHLQDRDAVTVARLCRRLEGIPLALELAAVSLRVLSLEQILQRLDDQFSLLTFGSRTALPRHKTLRALMDWSFTLCTEQEKALWTRLSVFTETFDLDACEAVCSGDELPWQEVLDALTGLLDKSVLLRQQRYDQARYRLLEPIRQYGREWLRHTNQGDRLRQRHRDWYLGLIRTVARDWFGPDQLDLFRRMQAEHWNIRAALESCIQEPKYLEDAMMAVAAMHDYWRAGGLVSEGRHWCDRLLEQGGNPTVARAVVFARAGYLALLQNDVDAAEELIQEGRRLASSLEDKSAVDAMRVPEAFLAMFHGDYRGSMTLCERYLAHQGDPDDLCWRANVLVMMGLNASLLGEPGRAGEAWSELRGLCSSHGEQWRQAYALFGLGVESWRGGDLRLARTLEQEAIAKFGAFDDPFCLAQCVETLAWITAGEGNAEQAAQLLGAAHMLRERVRGPLYLWFTDIHEHCESELRAALGDRRFRKAFDQGRDLTVDQVVLRVRGAPEPETRPVEKQAGHLTRRERQVAELIAQGMSNKQISSVLVISQRTAESHVENILVKLGLGSRAQIAAWVQRDKPADEV